MKRDHLEFPDFGFALLPEFYQKGYAKEASVGYLHNLFAKQPNLSIAAICKRENKPSIQLLEWIGFHYRHDTGNDGDQLSVYELKKENLTQQ
jgi:RimJ/RimL family protein N-acetyltransferase